MLPLLMLLLPLLRSPPILVGKEVAVCTIFEEVGGEDNTGIDDAFPETAGKTMVLVVGVKGDEDGDDDKGNECWKGDGDGENIEDAEEDNDMSSERVVGDWSTNPASVSQPGISSVGRAQRKPRSRLIIMWSSSHMRSFRPARFGTTSVRRISKVPSSHNSRCISCRMGGILGAEREGARAGE